MTLGQAITEGLKVTVVGITIVFAVLIILMLVLMLMKVIFYKEPTKATETVKNEAGNTPVPSVNEIDDTELIAVLTAAVVASLNTSTYNLNIKSYKRIGNNSPAWNKAGVRDIIDSRF